jgi:hypothetical protein
MINVVHYTIRGAVTLPEGSKLNECGTAIVLPGGKTLKPWEQFELHDPETGENTMLEYEDLTELGCFYDGDTAELEEVDPLPAEGGRVWPPR